jgi:hypothetical protein
MAYLLAGQGVQVIRVHEVAQTRQALETFLAAQKMNSVGVWEPARSLIRAPNLSPPRLNRPIRFFAANPAIPRLPRF